MFYKNRSYWLRGARIGLAISFLYIIWESFFSAQLSSFTYHFLGGILDLIINYGSKILGLRMLLQWTVGILTLGAGPLGFFAGAILFCLIYSAVWGILGFIYGKIRHKN